MTFKTILALATGLTMFAVPALAADTKPQIGSFGFDLAGMDTNVKAGDDFVGHIYGCAGNSGRQDQLWHVHQVA